MAKDIENEPLQYGDRVTMVFTVVGTHGYAVALQPQDEQMEKHPTVTYVSRLCKKTRPTATVEPA
jgi:hypothetical protein